MRAQGLLDGLGAVAGLGHDVDVVLGVEDGLQAAAQQALVVGDQDLDHGASGSRIDQVRAPRRLTRPLHGRT